MNQHLFKITFCDLEHDAQMKAEFSRSQIVILKKDSMHHWVGDGVVGADAEGEGADGGAGVALLVLTQ